MKNTYSEKAKRNLANIKKHHQDKMEISFSLLDLVKIEDMYEDPFEPQENADFLVSYSRKNSPSYYN